MACKYLVMKEFCGGFRVEYPLPHSVYETRKEANAAAKKLNAAAQRCFYEVWSVKQGKPVS